MEAVENWLHDFEQNREDPPEVGLGPTLKEYLLGRLTADEAAAKLSARMAADGVDLESALGDLWHCVNKAAQQLPAVRDRLVDLLAAFGRLPDLIRDGEPVAVWEMGVWQDLPLWGADVREKYNFRDPDASDPNRATLRQEETNFNAFLAKANASRHVPGFKHYAIWALRRALEDEDWTAAPPPPPSSDAHNNANGDEQTTISVLDGYVPPAAQWIFHAGRLVFNSDDEYRASNSDPAAGGALWTGKHGFCRERWRFWKERFAWVAARPELEPGTRDVARRAVEAMEEIERDPQPEVWRESLSDTH